MIKPAAPLLALLVLAGCGGKLGRSGLAGSYKAILISHEAEKPPPVADGSELEIRDNGTFTLKGFPKMEGRVQVAGDLITLDIERAGDKAVSDLKGQDGKPVAVPPLLLRQTDGGTRLRPDAENKNPLKFTWVRTER
jgi:hypothetical protein